MSDQLFNLGVQLMRDAKLKQDFDAEPLPPTPLNLMIEARDVLRGLHGERHCFGPDHCPILATIRRLEIGIAEERTRLLNESGL